MLFSGYSGLIEAMSAEMLVGEVNRIIALSCIGISKATGLFVLFVL